jgi:hypothetical protein
MHSTRRSPGADMPPMCPVSSLQPEVTAVLDRPLGNRVLLDISGAPVIVTPEHLITGPVWATRAQRALRRGDGTHR